MGRNLDPKCKQCRRLGEKLFLKGERCNSPKCAIIKRNYPPGFHGPKGRGKVSDYGTQLKEKQKAKKMYGLLEKQFRLTFERAKKAKGEVGNDFIRLLELRLDNAIVRLGLASSHTMARQMVKHGFITVNDVKVDIPSFELKTGDVIKIKESKKRSKIFTNTKEKNKKADIPGWLNFDAEKMTAKVLHAPKNEDISMILNPQMIVEFYSR